jgi:hypothetical protein
MMGENLILDRALDLVRLLLDPLRRCAVQLVVHHNQLAEHHNHLFKLELGS